MVKAAVKRLYLLQIRWEVAEALMMYVEAELCWQLIKYNVDNSKNDELPIPSTFTKNAFVFGSVDNTDFDEKNSIAGAVESEHVTSVVLYKEINAKPEPKPSVSSLGLRKSNL